MAGAPITLWMKSHSIQSNNQMVNSFKWVFPIHAFRSLAVGRKADYSIISLSMPRSFAEVWLQIYTKECKFCGLVQATYRQILKMLQPSDVTHPHDEAEQEDPDLMIKIWTPGTGTESPGTPRSSSCNVSLGSLAELRAAAGQLARPSTPGTACGCTAFLDLATPCACASHPVMDTPLLS